MKSNITTAVLFVCAALLGAFIWFVERDSESSAQKNLRTQTVFATYPAEIDWIRLERGETIIECTRTAGTWRMTHPVDAPVNAAIVERMIAGMASVKHGERISAAAMDERGLTPSDYGFDQPRATITFRNNHGTFMWQIGRDTPLGNSLYVMAADSREIISTAQNLLNLVPESPAWIRDRTLFKKSAAAVHGIDLRRPNGIVQIRKTGENQWTIEQPFNGRADAHQVHELIDHAVEATIVDFISDEPADRTAFGLEEPVMELSLLDPEDHPQTLFIGKTDPEKPEQRYAKWADSPGIFTIETQWATSFEIESAQLRSRQILDLSPARIEQVSLSTKQEQIELVRTDEQWNLVRPAHWEAEAESVQALIDRLAGGLIHEFVDSPNPTREALERAPRWSITLRAGEQTQTLRFQFDARQRLILTRDEDSTHCVVDSELIRPEFADPLFYRNRTMLTIDPPEIRRIDLKTPRGKFRVEKKADEFVAPDRAQAPDLDALSELTAELSQLRSQQLIAFNPPSLIPYGLNAPTAQLTVTLAGTNTIGQVILLGHSIDGGRYAMLRGHSVVFVLPEKTAQTLTRELTHPVEQQTTELARPE